VLLVFVLGVVVCAPRLRDHDFLDRDIDPHVQRTRDRPLAARRVLSVRGRCCCLRCCSRWRCTW